MSSSDSLSTLTDSDEEVPSKKQRLTAKKAVGGNPEPQQRKKTAKKMVSAEQGPKVFSMFYKHLSKAF
jgi:hypothetical protein